MTEQTPLNSPLYPMSRLYRASLIIGATPLALGTVTFALWLLTRWEAFVLAGIYVTYLGIACAVVSLGCLLGHLRSAGFSRETGKNVGVAGGVILLNIPVCVAIIYAVFAIETRYVIVFTNESDVVISELVVSGPGVDLTWRNIEPGKRVRKGMYFAGPGVVTYEGVVQTETYRGVIAGYVTRGVGGKAILRYTWEQGFVIDQTPVEQRNGI